MDKYYYQVQFNETDELSDITMCVKINLLDKELSVMKYKRENVIKSMGIILSDEDVEMIKSYCLVKDFEPYRDGTRDISKLGECISRSHVSMMLIGISDSEYPMIKISMDKVLEEHSPAHKLYDFIQQEFIYDANTSRKRIYRENGEIVKGKFKDFNWWWS